MAKEALETPKDLTDRQFKVLCFIEQEIQQQGYPPTIREIGRQLGIKSTNGVNDHLKALQRKGYIARSDHKSRTLKVLKSGMPSAPASASNVVSLPRKSPAALPAVLGASASSTGGGAANDVTDIPVLGRVAAGSPILAIENPEDSLPVPDWLLSGSGRQKQFALEVQGDSMIGDGIYHGDVVFVSQNSTAKAGDLVVAMIDEEVTVKRFFPEGDRIRLQPSNPRLDPIFVTKSEGVAFAVLGHVTGVFGRFPRNSP